MKINVSMIGTVHFYFESVSQTFSLYLFLLFVVVVLFFSLLPTLVFLYFWTDLTTDVIELELQNSGHILQILLFSENSDLIRNQLIINFLNKKLKAVCFRIQIWQQWELGGVGGIPVSAAIYLLLPGTV